MISLRSVYSYLVLKYGTDILISFAQNCTWVLRVLFCVIKVAACNLSSAGAPSKLSPGIRALQTITPKLKDALITEVQMEFPGGQDPNFSELGEWG